MKKEITEKELQAVKTLLEFIGENPGREGLKETPKRFLKAWLDYWAIGYHKDPRDHLKVFEEPADSYSEMVLVKDIKVMSHCEHHIAPIIGVAHIAYIPNGKVIGLSKLNRIVENFARRLQVQERLTDQIASFIQDNLNPIGVAVCITADHFCVKTRGISDINSYTTTYSFKAAFAEPNSQFKSDFLNSIK